MKTPNDIDATIEFMDLFHRLPPATQTAIIEHAREQERGECTFDEMLTRWGRAVKKHGGLQS